MALLARKLRYGFRCRVLGFDPYVDPRIARVADVELIPDLKALLVQSHILVLVPELTEETRNMIGAEELATLPQGAIVVNTGRGQVLQLAALASALDRGHIFAAGLDVFHPEPLPPGHPLLDHPRVTFSPHIAGKTVDANRRLARSAADQIVPALRGEMPTFPVNAAAWRGLIRVAR